jgi:hypothetical protein
LLIYLAAWQMQPYLAKDKLNLLYLATEEEIAALSITSNTT